MTSLLLAYGSLFLWSFLAATVLPLSSEVALIALVRSRQHLLLPVLVATAGNYCGACTTYWLGRRAGSTLDLRRQPTRTHRYAADLLRRYGQPTLLLSWVPLIGDAVV
ncbi:MAG TPA: DedA family protein, partial [Sphingomicrobium sp.]